MSTVNTTTTTTATTSPVNTAAQHALVQALNTTLRTTCAAQVAAFEGDGRCQIQVIGMQADGAQPWAPSLLMTHRLPVTTKSSDSASNYSQWAFRLALSGVTAPEDMGPVMTSWSARLDGIRKALVTLNRNLGFVDNHDKDDVFVDLLDDFVTLIDTSGLEFVRCPDKAATVGHIRQPACPALTKGKLENWIANWARTAWHYKSPGLPELTPEFLASLCASRQAGIWFGKWRRGHVEVTPETGVTDGVARLVLSTVVESRIPSLEPEERQDGESMLWQDFGHLVVDERTLGMSVADFMSSVCAGVNPLAPNAPASARASQATQVDGDGDEEGDDSSDEDGLSDEDRELLRAYRENFHDESATLEEVQDRSLGRARSEGNWVAEWYEATSQLDGVPDSLRPHIEWDDVAKQMRVDGSVYFVTSAGWTWAFTTTR
jgi:hypothetical protein